MALVFLLLMAWLTVRYIPNQQVGVVEKLWSSSGSVSEGRIIALEGEAGFQADLLRGGLHFGLWRWQYRVHRVPLVKLATISRLECLDVYEQCLRQWTLTAEPAQATQHAAHGEAFGVVHGEAQLLRR